jgi:3-hydroxy-9,10-secoandrosta-1,3,5(10)-triene-9,17-dione monooxygenase reductase component
MTSSLSTNESPRDDRPDALRRIDPLVFRQALGQFATGVTIVTTRAPDGTPVGLTANSFTSLSLDPPLVLWSLARSARSREVFESSEHFAIHVLGADQLELSMRFASRSDTKFAGLMMAEGHGGVPLLANCAARFQCRKTEAIDGGDHRIYIGEVLELDHCACEPLLFHAGQYGRKHKA